MLWAKLLVCCCCMCNYVQWGNLRSLMIRLPVLALNPCRRFWGVTLGHKRGGSASEGADCVAVRPCSAGVAAKQAQHGVRAGAAAQPEQAQG